jgi:multisubunit Na+/H+ antiporter MnhG subunit
MDDRKAANKEEVQRLQLAQINRALGVFLLFFGSIIVVAVLFTETFIGRMSNLAAGLILGLIGTLFVFRAKGRQKMPRQNDVPE